MRENVRAVIFIVILVAATLAMIIAIGFASTGCTKQVVQTEANAVCGVLISEAEAEFQGAPELGALGPVCDAEVGAALLGLLNATGAKPQTNAITRVMIAKKVLELRRAKEKDASP